jgi:hypothetical protein
MVNASARTARVQRRRRAVSVHPHRRQVGPVAVGSVHGGTGPAAASWYVTVDQPR